jgi:hypothetical protein
VRNAHNLVGSPEEGRRLEKNLEVDRCAISESFLKI